MTIQIEITGKVQGVFYRATAKKIADKLQVKGWIRNMENGNVEAVVSGENEMISEFTEWCKKGPAAAVVHNVVIKKCIDSNFNDFSIRHS